jgi:hypothetical protein
MAVVIGGGGGGGTTPITVTGGGAGVTYTANPWANNGKIKLEGSDADIFVQGKSMKAWMDAVEQRLCILEPKPELLTKYESLRQAYEHYKTLEAILYEQE